MQLLPLWLWCRLAASGAGRHSGCTRAVLAAGLAAAMGSQMYLLWLDGQLSLQTALPLHLCGFSAVLCLVLLLRFSETLYHFLLLLGLPGALLALMFPAVTPSSSPLLMHMAFWQLHACIAAVAVFFARQQRPLPREAYSTFLLGNGLVLLAALANRLTGSNYLFLRAAPAGTPLALLIRHGYGVYLVGLELLCMLLLKLLLDLYFRYQATI